MIDDDRMEEASLVEGAAAKKPGFWKRQALGEATLRQRVFDAVFGAVVPILLLIFDPIVFRGDDSCVGPGVILPHLGVFAYLGIGLGAFLLLFWLMAGPRLARWAGMFAGLFQAGFVFALLLGIVMLPFSILGLFAIIGILGFLPFITAFVYRRNTIRAQRLAHETYPTWGKLKHAAVMLAGAILVLTIPILAQWQTARIIRQSVATLSETGNPQAEAQAEQTLRTLYQVCLGFCTQNIKTYFQAAIYQNQEMRERFQQHFEAITGNPYIYVDCSTVYREGVIPLLVRLLA